METLKLILLLLAPTNTIYDNTVLSSTKTVEAGGVIEFYNNGLYWVVIP